MNLYDFEATNRDGSTTKLDSFAGKVVLVVNTATGCGFTPQYEDLERIYAAYRDRGFEILDFPCNQFREQAPGTDEEIHQFCTAQFGTEFPQFSKVEVNGEGAHPLFAWLGTQKPFESWGGGMKAIPMKAVGKAVDKEFGDAAYVKWNFTKFLCDREGNVIARFEPTVDMKEVEAAIEAAL